MADTPAEKKPNIFKRIGIGILKVVLFPLALFVGTKQSDE